MTVIGVRSELDETVSLLPQVDTGLIYVTDTGTGPKESHTAAAAPDTADDFLGRALNAAGELDAPRIIRFANNGRANEIVPPIITLDPVGGAITLGDPIALVIAGTSISTIQWFKDDVAIVGETALTFDIAVSEAGDDATYHATVKNGAGSDLSTDAVITFV